MKGLLVILLSCGMALAVNHCCSNDAYLVHGGCGDGGPIQLTCEKKMLITDVILHGDKLSTMDAPSYVLVNDPTQYCLGKIYGNRSNPVPEPVDVALLCYEKEVAINAILTLISVFFLLATIAVYTYLPQMRDLQGMCYISTCVSMALGFLSLAILQLNPGFKEEVCTVTGFLLYSWMMATFFWMNVISINTFRTALDAAFMQKTEKMQYFLYSCYAWGSTLLLLVISLITNFAEGNHWKPGIGQESCFISGNAETWIFFYGPITILITANVVLFVLSSLLLWQQRKKYEVNTLNNLKHRFLLSMKLFLVMGIPWIFEIASFAHGESHIIWKIMDTFNCLQGIVIFLLLVVFRRRAMRGLANDNFCTAWTRPLAERLSPHDDPDDEHMLADETVEVRLH